MNRYPETNLSQRDIQYNDPKDNHILDDPEWRFGNLGDGIRNSGRYFQFLDIDPLNDNFDIGLVGEDHLVGNQFVQLNEGNCRCSNYRWNGIMHIDL